MAFLDSSAPVPALGQHPGVLSTSPLWPCEQIPCRRDVVIFRQNLFRISEPFIAQQAQQLQRYRPIFAGRRRCGDPTDQAQSRALQDLGRRAWPQVGWHMLTRRAEPYRRLLQSGSPALIHAHFGVDAVYALPLAKRLGVPLVTTFHGFDATLSTATLLRSPIWANFVLFRRQLAAQGDLFLCVSAFIRDRVLEMGFPAARTHVLYTGVDHSTIAVRTPHEETPVILHVARLVEMKGTCYLLHAFGRIARNYPGLTLAIIGEGNLLQKLRRLASDLGIADRVAFLGALPHAQVMRWMRQAAMLVLPSVRTSSGRVEGLGMVLLEAAATGVPVIGSIVGGIPEAIVDGQTGFLVPPRDIDALTQRIEYLLNDPATRSRMGAQARAFIEDRFDIRQQTQRLETFYDTLLSDQRTG